MRLIALVMFFCAAMSGCSNEQSEEAGNALGTVARRVGDVIAPTATGAAQGFTDAVISKPLNDMLECSKQRQPPRVQIVTVDVPGRPAKECVAEQGGVINEEVMKCRKGFKRQERIEVPHVPDPSVRCR